MTIALDIFRALADSTRLRILALLRSMELSVGELAQVLGQSQPRVSRHVKILCDAGLAERRKEGSWVFVVPGRRDRIDPIISALDAWDRLEPDHWAVADAARLAAVRADRASAAQSWFAQHAAEWDAIRSLHVAEEQVEAAMKAALGEPVSCVPLDRDAAATASGWWLRTVVGTGDKGVAAVEVRLTDEDIEELEELAG